MSSGSSSSRPHARQTAHLRKSIFKASRNIRTARPSHKSKRSYSPPPPVPTKSASHHWHRIGAERQGTSTSASVSAHQHIKEACVQAPPHLQTAENDQDICNARTNTLCKILSELVRRFQTEGKYYCAMAASAAEQLVRRGRDDDINPGLYQYIRQAEEERAKEQQ